MLKQLDTSNSASSTDSSLDLRIAEIGEKLAQSFGHLLDAIPGGPYGPAELARLLSIDKVLASRLLKSVENRDPLATLYLAPGPDPLRRVIRAAAKQKPDPQLLIKAEQAVASFESLIRQEAGDRSALDAIISAWLPEVRQEFELRRKQTAFRAISQLKGSAANINLATVLLHPSDDNKHVDVVWLFGLLGLRRLRPDASVKFATRRMSTDEQPRHPRTLDGVAVEGLDGLRLDEFCSSPIPEFDVHQIGEVVHYTLAGNNYGPRTAADLIFAEANFAEIDRFLQHESKRKAYVFAEVGTPAKVLVFDVLVHKDVYPGAEPTLAIYDTAFDGVADVNDRARDIDRLDLCETIQMLGEGISKFRTAQVPRYAKMLEHVMDQLKWDASMFRGYRCKIDYPLYGSQVAMMFDAPPPPTS